MSSLMPSSDDPQHGSSSSLTDIGDVDELPKNLRNLSIKDETPPRKRAVSTSVWEKQSSRKERCSAGQRQQQHNKPFHKILEESTKSSRHYARRLRNRGLPKKKGAGGAFVWGKLGSEFKDGVMKSGAIDKRDPNYESDEEPYEVIREKMIKANQRIGCDFDLDIKPILEEYFYNGDAYEFIDGLNHWRLGSQRHSDLIQFLIVLAMEREEIHRELISTLLVPLSLEFANKRQIDKAFLDMFNNMDGMITDIPRSVEYLAKFIARALGDNVLNEESIEILRSETEATAETKLCTEKAIEYFKEGNLDKIWMPLVANRYPVQRSVEQLKSIIDTFWTIKHIDSIADEIKKLCIPHFLHELVYLLIEALVEQRNNVMDVEMTCDLLKQLVDTGVMPKGEMKLGVKRVIDDMSLIEMYTRNAYRYMSQIVEGLTKRELLDDYTAYLFEVETKKRRPRTICLSEKAPTILTQYQQHPENDTSNLH